MSLRHAQSGTAPGAGSERRRQRRLGAGNAEPRPPYPVERLQVSLNEGHGEFVPTSAPILATDGVYGPKTASPVRGAQHEAGIAEKGMVDLRTWALPVHAAGQVLADICGVPGPGEG